MKSSFALVCLFLVSSLSMAGQNDYCASEALYASLVAKNQSEDTDTKNYIINNSLTSVSSDDGVNFIVSLGDGLSYSVKVKSLDDECTTETIVERSCLYCAGN